MKLAILASHPIQYLAPLFRKIAEQPGVDLSVFYCSDHGIAKKVDVSFGVAYQWDIPLLDGYRHVFLKNHSPRPSVSKFGGLINFGIIYELFRGRYDAIIIHGYTVPTDLLAFVGAWLTRTPVIFRGETVLRGDRPWWKRALKYILVKTLFRGTSAFLSIGSMSEEFYLHYGVPAKKIFFTPYSVDNEYFIGKNNHFAPHKNELKRETGISPNLMTIIFVGKLIERKRPLDLLWAFSKIDSGRAALVFVGDGSMRKEMEAIAREEKIQNVFFPGFINQGDLPKYYAMADVFVLPSSSAEVSPLVINEAMCSRLPVVVSDAIPSAHDFVKNGENGFVYPEGDLDALGAHLDDLTQDEHKRKRMGEQSLKFISKWNYDACVDGINKALHFVTHHDAKK